MLPAHARRAGLLVAALITAAATLGLSGVRESLARADPAPSARLDGRVFERGTWSGLPEARVVTSQGATATSDDKGRFSLTLAPGAVELSLSAAGFETLKVTEHLEAGKGVSVDYRLLRRSDGAGYHSEVRGDARHEGQRFSLDGAEAAGTAGALGDPARVISMLPGVATPLPLLPFYSVRGSSPGMNGYFLDGMALPQLFHILVGGGVVPPRMTDRVDFYPGAYDVTFGRYAGGIMDMETRPARAGAPHAEVELRLYDVSTVGEAELPGGIRVAAGGHYGYPAPLLQLLAPGVSLSYWDYFLRVDIRAFTLEALGSSDALALAPAGTDDLGAQGLGHQLGETFHRVQLRFHPRVAGLLVDAAVVGGYDQSSAFNGTGVQKLSLAFRASVRARLPHLRIAAGLDGELSRFRADNLIPDGDAMPQVAPDEYGALTGDRDGIVAGAYAQGTVDLWDRRFTATLGARADVYHAADVTLVGIDPRVSATLHPLPFLNLSAGLGLYQQPPSFPVPIPGIDTFALELGLQRAWQGAVTVDAALPFSFTLSLTGYYQKFQNVTDFIIEITDATCQPAPPMQEGGLGAKLLREEDGDGYGMELLLRRHAGRFTGWIAYTLGRSERALPCGLRPSDFDQTHILNVVFQARLPRRIMAGVRLYYATGHPVTILSTSDPESTPHNNTRLPDYVQVDVRFDKEWTFNHLSIAAFLEVLNLTYSTANYGITYPTIDGLPDIAHPHTVGFQWILPSIGVRARL